jgi:hypothetical protein
MPTGVVAKASLLAWTHHTTNMIPLVFCNHDVSHLYWSRGMCTPAKTVKTDAWQAAFHKNQEDLWRGPTPHVERIGAQKNSIFVVKLIEGGTCGEFCLTKERINFIQIQYIITFK